MIRICTVMTLHFRLHVIVQMTACCSAPHYCTSPNCELALSCKQRQVCQGCCCAACSGSCCKCAACKHHDRATNCKWLAMAQLQSAGRQSWHGHRQVILPALFSRKLFSTGQQWQRRSCHALCTQTKAISLYAPKYGAVGGAPNGHEIIVCDLDG